MTFEPGTSDTMTTMDPPFPGEVSSQSYYPFHTIKCPEGWEIEISEIAQGSGLYRVLLMHNYWGAISNSIINSRAFE